jgi:hypothetical protein
MIAQACVATSLHPSVFGIDPEDMPAVALAIIDVLEEQAEEARREMLRAKARGGR